jgi:plasmid stabilization system protein ParE
VARIELTPEVLEDFDRFVDHLTQFNVADAEARIAEVIQTLEILAVSPLIGRKVKAGKRELVIGRDTRGYVALYRFVRDVDTVFILALRSQRESGYNHH